MSIVKAMYRKASLAVPGQYHGHISLDRSGLGKGILGGRVNLSLENPQML